MAKATKEPTASKPRKNGGAQAAQAPATPPMSETDMAEKIAKLRSQVRESFGKVVMAMMTQPRYKHQSLADLSHLVLEPLTMDRIAMAYGRNMEAGAPDMAGLAIWASVSEDVDMKIRKQIRAGTFPVRLKPDEWTSGKINWLLDVIAIDQKTTGQVIANFRQVVKDGELRLHPIITKLVDAETLAKMQQSHAGQAESEAGTSGAPSARML